MIKKVVRVDKKAFDSNKGEVFQEVMSEQNAGTRTGKGRWSKG
jgi:hypothetical protein